MEEETQLQNLLSAMHHAGMAAASEDHHDGVSYDPDYIFERADASATACGAQTHLRYAFLVEMTTEWLAGYQQGYVNEQDGSHG